MQLADKVILFLAFEITKVIKSAFSLKDILYCLKHSTVHRMLLLKTLEMRFQSDLVLQCVISSFFLSSFILN